MAAGCAGGDSSASQSDVPEKANSSEITADTTTAPESSEPEQTTTTKFTCTTAQWKEPQEYGKVIALTFDDGPNTTTTNEVLDVLEENGIVASFFVIGTNINEQTVPVMQRAAAMGCEINSHSMTHSYMNGMKEEEITAEIESVNKLIEDAVGSVPKFFRPPYIATSGRMYRLIDQTFISGYGCNDWDSKVDVKMRVEKTLEQAEDGAIILLHDAAGNYQTVEAIKQIIPELKAQGYEFVTVSELFHAKGVELNPDLMTIYSKVPQ